MYFTPDGAIADEAIGPLPSLPRPIGAQQYAGVPRLRYLTCHARFPAWHCRYWHAVQALLSMRRCSRPAQQPCFSLIIKVSCADSRLLTHGLPAAVAVLTLSPPNYEAYVRHARLLLLLLACTCTC